MFCWEGRGGGWRISTYRYAQGLEYILAEDNGERKNGLLGLYGVPC